MTDVTLVTGDGIGPEIAEATRRCVDATGADIKSICTEAGMFAIREDRDTVTQADFLQAVDKVMTETLKGQESGVMFA